MGFSVGRERLPEGRSRWRSTALRQESCPLGTIYCQRPWQRPLLCRSIVLDVKSLVVETAPTTSMTIRRLVLALVVLLTYQGALAQNTGIVGAVIPINYPPNANRQEIVVSPGNPTSIALTGDDANGDTFVFAIVSNPSYGTLSGLDSTTGAVTLSRRRISSSASSKSGWNL